VYVGGYHSFLVIKKMGHTYLGGGEAFRDSKQEGSEEWGQHLLREVR